MATMASKPLTHFEAVFTMNPENTIMNHKVVRMGLMFFLALLIAVPSSLLAQNPTDSQTIKSDNKDKNSKDKAQDNKAKDKGNAKKPKNSDVENIGNRSEERRVGKEE